MLKKQGFTQTYLVDFFRKFLYNIITITRIRTMQISVKGGSKTQKKYAKDIIRFCGAKLMSKRLAKSLNIKVHFVKGLLDKYNQAGNCINIVKSLYKKIPILGVCLGHQIIGQVFDSKIIQAKKLMHGKISKIKSKRKGILKNLPNKFSATRYHSLIIDKKTLPKNLTITAETKDGIIMGVKHNNYNIHGVQFHPESIKTPIGMRILNNFINYKVK